jgi:hypothetical protein
VTSNAQSEARLTVGRWICIWSVPSSDAAANDLRQYLDEAVSGLLAERCDVHTAPVVRPEDTSVWRIRRLDLNVSLDSGHVRAADASADVWSRQLALTLARVIQENEEGDTVLRFENCATFVARFVLDLAGNRAWGKWYYEEFEDLRMFPPSQAIRTVLLRESGLAADVIALLASQRNLDVVLVVLKEKDASLIFDSCFESVPAVPAAAGLDKWAAILLECCVSEPLFLLSPGEGYSSDALRLFARAALCQPGAATDGALHGAILGLLELRRVLSFIRSPIVLESIIQKAAVGEVDSAIDLAIRSSSLDSADALRFFGNRMQGDVDWGREAVAVLLNGNLPARVVNTASVPKREPLLSPFAGIFLLGSSFLNLRCSQLAESAAERGANPSDLAAIVRHLIAVKCLGSARASDVAGDAAVCLFSGFSGSSFFSSLASIEMDQLNVDAVREPHWQTLRESERISDRCVLAELVSVDGRERLVLCDLVGNEWLDVVELPGEPNDLATLVPERLTVASRALAMRPKMVLLGSSLATRFDLSVFRDVAEELAVVHPDEPAQLARLADQCGLSTARLQTLLAATKQEFAYFSLRSVVPDLDEKLDDTFSFIARAVLRDFSRRVFGFDLSSPEYLYQNFLAGLGSVLCRDEALEVRLPVSPLAVILRMAGLQQQKFQPPWLQGREVWLLPPQD